MRRMNQNRRKGAVAVEFALTAPLLFLVLFGALELGHANMVFNVTEAAAFEGARAGIIPGATAAEVTGAAQQILQISNIDGANIQVTPNNLANESDSIEVRITIPYAQNTLMPPFFTGGLSIERTCKLTREG